MNNPRPVRQHTFQHPHWPPAPTRAPPTPAIVRAARAAAVSVPSSDHHTQSRAQQVQARALAAQAAHQQRVHRDVSDDMPHRTSFGAVPSDFKFGVGFTGFTNRHRGATPPTYPSLNNAQDLVDELQVDMSLHLEDREDNRPFTSPSESVDISAWLPPPGPPVLIADDASIAASAVPFSDWAAEFVWILAGRSTSSTSGTTYGGFATTLKWLNDPDVLCHQSPSGPAFASFKAFVKEALSATITSPQGLFLALLYISKLPVGNVFVPSGFSSRAGGIVEWSSREFEFRSEVYGLANVYGHVAPGSSASLLFTLGLMLSNKWLEDNTFTTKTWHDVTSISQAQLRSVETAALGLFGFSLVVHDQEWLGWLLALRRYTSSLGASAVKPSGVGVIGDRLRTQPSANYAVMNKVDELIKDAKAKVEEKKTDNKEPARSDVMDENGEVHYPSLAPVRKHSHSRTTSLPTTLVQPVAWAVPTLDMQLDSPVYSSLHAHHPYNNHGLTQRHPHHSVDQQHQTSAGQTSMAAYYDDNDAHDQYGYENEYERPVYILSQQSPRKRRPGMSNLSQWSNDNNPFENDMVPHPGLMISSRMERERRERMYGAGEEHLRAWPHPPTMGGFLQGQASDYQQQFHQQYGPHSHMGRIRI
ncbi:hypothetical protein FRC02_006362 [Tulasnella sp. 418]|nr:hypothetical protein FRC02_006362 [Tulasnella sp. 418]